MIQTIYQDPLWGKSQEVLEEGSIESFHFENEKGTVNYQYVKRFAGTVDGTDYYDILTPRGKGGPWIDENISSDIWEDFFDAFFRHCEKKAYNCGIR